MLFACGVGVGLFFYGVAEPVFHYTQPNRYRIPGWEMYKGIEVDIRVTSPSPLHQPYTVVPSIVPFEAAVLYHLNPCAGTPRTGTCLTMSLLRSP